MLNRVVQIIFMLLLQVYIFLTKIIVHLTLAESVHILITHGMIFQAGELKLREMQIVDPLNKDSNFTF